MSLQDFNKPFDPTFYTSLTGAQLSQLFDGLSVYADKGLIITTTDDGFGNPQAPDAINNPKFQRYLWRRISKNSVFLYQWNPYSGIDPLIYKWNNILQFSLPFNSVGADQIINGSISDVKISNLTYGKLIGAPASLPPSGPAGGSLSGNYPNPIINPADNSIAPVKLVIPATSPGFNLRIKTDGSQPEFAAFGVIQSVFKKLAGQLDDTAVVTDGAPTVVQGTQIANINFTPISATSIIRIKLVGEMFTSGAHNGNYALFFDGNLVSLVVVNNGGAGYPGGQSCLEAVVASWGAGVAKSCQARFGTTTDNTQHAYFGVNNANSLSIFSVEEIFGTLTAAP